MVEISENSHLAIRANGSWAAPTPPASLARPDPSISQKLQQGNLRKLPGLQIETPFTEEYLRPRRATRRM